MVSPVKSRRQHKRLLYTLLMFFPLLAGCGLGWLYMRVGDSERIKAMKLLTYDTSKDRFSNSTKLYLKAIDNYRESIMYDESGNPMVYHKLGFTLLLLPEPDLGGAEREFKNGIKLKKGKQDQATQAATSSGGTPTPSESGGGFRKDKQDTSDTPAPSASAAPSGPRDPGAEARSEEEVVVDNDLSLAENYAKKDEDFALMNSGLGMVHFLRGIATKKDDELRLATKYFRLADKFSGHPTSKKGAQGTLQKILASFDLEEIVDPTPHMVLLARVYNYSAGKNIDAGKRQLADSDLVKATDALDAVKMFYEKEPRYLAELAHIHFLKEEWDKCVSVLKSIAATQGYADLKVTNTMRCRALIKLALQKSGGERNKLLEEAMGVVQDLLDREPDDPRAMLLRAACYAYQEPRNYTEMKSNIDQVFSVQKNKENHLLLMEAGDVYMALGEDDKKQAKSFYQQAFYIAPRDVKINYLLGKAYQALAAVKSTPEDQASNTANMKECFGRVCKIDPSSKYCLEVAPLVQ